VISLGCKNAGSCGILLFCGKPEESIRIRNDQESIEAAQERLNKLLAPARGETDSE